MAIQNKHCSKDLCTDSSLNTGRNGDEEVSKRSRSKSKFTCKYACRDREPSRLQFKKIIKMFKKSKSSLKRIKCYIMYNTPHLSGMKNFLSIDFGIYLATRLCRSRPVGKKSSSAYHCITHDIYIVKTRTYKHKHKDLLLYVNDDCGLNNCCSVKCNKQQEKYCVSRAKICTSGDIDLNPGPVNGYSLLQSRLAQRGLSLETLRLFGRRHPCWNSSQSSYFCKQTWACHTKLIWQEFTNVFSEQTLFKSSLSFISICQTYVM